MEWGHSVAMTAIPAHSIRVYRKVDATINRPMEAAVMGMRVPPTTRVPKVNVSQGHRSVAMTAIPVRKIAVSLAIASSPKWSPPAMTVMHAPVCHCVMKGPVSGPRARIATTTIAARTMDAIP